MYILYMHVLNMCMCHLLHVREREREGGRVIDRGRVSYVEEMTIASISIQLCTCTCTCMYIRTCRFNLIIMVEPDACMHSTYSLTFSQ